MADSPRYIAHPGQSLEAHLFGVADLAMSFAQKVGLGNQGELIGLMHDLGKYSDQFQSYLRSAAGLINPDEDDYVAARELKGKVDHSTAGAQLVWNEVSKAGELGRVVGQVLALCIASHHSGLIDCLSSDARKPVEDTFTKRLQKSDERTHLHEVSERMDSSIRSRLDRLLGTPDLLEAMKKSIRRIMLCDRVGGLDPFRNQITQFKLGLLVRFLFSCLIDADRIDSADSEKPRSAKERPRGKYAEWPLLIDRLEKHLGGFPIQEPIDRLRRNISDRCRDGAARKKGIYTLTVPTGGGKTLASLRFALHHAEHHGMDRVIYFIPFTSIIDQNADVVRKILEPTEEDSGRVVLEHHSNLTAEQQGWKEKMLSENWDAPVVFTTNVQLLESLFGGGTRGARRMHQLANAVLIFDEVQTVPINCVHLFCNAMNFLVEHCGSTVVLCTATQPLLNAVDPAKGAMKFTSDDELMPDVQELFGALKRVDVLNQRKPEGWSDEKTARLAVDEVIQCGSCLVIVNTKRSARALYQLCRESDGIQAFHLSTDMCPAHRKEVLREIRARLERKSPVLCVSTQLIEAGVDVDFGAVIRHAAGLDSVAQAAGRCNRNGRRQVGRVHLINPSTENLDRLEDIRCGKEKTERILDDVKAGVEDFGGDLVGPRAMERYFQYYFFDRRSLMDYPVAADAVGRNDTLLNLLSTNSMALSEYGRTHDAGPSIYFRQSFKSASSVFKVIDAPTRGIVVPHGDAGRELIVELCAAFEVEKQFKLLRRAQQYTVNVFPRQLEQLENAGAVHEIQAGVDILYLSDARYYTSEFGLSETPEGNMEVLLV